jgi:N-acetylglucosamine-6-sulfatase
MLASIRIPLFIRYPGLVEGGSRPGFLVGNVDIAPTMMDIAGVRVPGGMDGKSMVDTLKDPTTPLRDALLIEYYSDTEFPRLQGLGYQAIRTNRYKYIRYRELRGADELYDLNADPYELDNLLPEAAAGPLKIGLNQQLDGLLRSHGSGVDPTRK